MGSEVLGRTDGNGKPSGAAAKAANVDLTKFNGDLDKLVFVPKPANGTTITVPDKK